MGKARETIQEAVKLGIAPMLKKHGFKKTGLNFARRNGAVAHYLNVHLSSWNQGPEGAFYLNAGLMFDEICRHYGTEPPQLPKYADCNFMVRLERLDPRLPFRFEVDEGTNVGDLAQTVSDAIEKAFVVPAAPGPTGGRHGRRRPARHVRSSRPASAPRVPRSSTLNVPLEP